MSPTEEVIEIDDATAVEERTSRRPGLSLRLNPEQVRAIFGANLEKQIEEQNKRIDELIQKDRERQEAYMEQGVKLTKVEKENRELHKRVNELQKIIEQEISPVPFEHSIDTRMFKGININKIQCRKLCDDLYDLSIETNTNQEYIINKAVDVVPIFKIMKEDKNIPFNFIGTYEDFVYFWNENIALRQPTEERVHKLSINTKTLKASVNEPIWKNVGIMSWYRLSQEANKDSARYEKAEILRKKIESFK